MRRRLSHKGFGSTTVASRHDFLLFAVGKVGGRIEKRRRGREGRKLKKGGKNR